jgi:hypothetical protein
MIDCSTATFYHNLGPGVNGTNLLNQTLYLSSGGGAVIDGYYSDAVYIYTVSGSLVTYVETASSLGCQGTTPEPTATPIPQGTLYNFAFNSSSHETACSLAV